jgi:hypothetical protein
MSDDGDDGWEALGGLHMNGFFLLLGDTWEDGVWVVL